MARITVEDCLEHVDNLFELVLLSSRRARQLANGAQATVDWQNDKPTVVALREIAEGNITTEILDEVDAANAAPDPEELLRAELNAPHIDLPE